MVDVVAECADRQFHVVRSGTSFFRKTLDESETARHLLALVTPLTPIMKDFSKS